MSQGVVEEIFFNSLTSQMGCGLVLKAGDGKF